MSFERPTLSTLIARAEADIDARLPGADSRLRRSALSVLARTHAGAVDGLYGMLDDLARFLPDVADRDRLSRWSAIFGLTRKVALAAGGTVGLTGISGTGVPVRTVLIRGDGVRFRTTAASAIVGGIAIVDVAAEAEGAGGNTAGGQLLTFASPIAGVQAIAMVQPSGIVGGVAEEDDDALRARLLARLRAPPRGGAASDYVAWALEVPEVTRAWVYGNWNGLGTVKVLFVMDGRVDSIPTAPDVAATAAHIAARRPVGAQVTVAGPLPNPLALTIDLTPDTPAVRAAVEAELRDLIAREAEPGGTLLISHIREAISIAAGEADHTLTTPTANVSVAAGYITTLGAITWL